MSTDIVRTDQIKERDSNMEALRIVAMLLVLVVHAGFYSLGVPRPSQALHAPMLTLTRLFFQSVSVIAVLVFVLISGWFGIRPKRKGVFNFLFQCWFYSLIIYVVMLCLGRAHFTWKAIQNVLLFVNSFWFIKAYLCLMLFAPVLNAFIDTATERQFRVVLGLFILFQCLYGWLSTGAAWLERGYSVVSFFGLYMLGRYARLYPCRAFTLPRKFDMLIYWGIVFFTTGVAFVLLRQGCSEKTIDVVYRLTSPFIIAEALYLLLFFSKLKFQNRTVNWVAASCFAVFLIQQNPYIGRPIYAKTIAGIYAAHSGLSVVLLIAGFILALFVACILVDQVRKFVWNNTFNKKRIS